MLLALGVSLGGSQAVSWACRSLKAWLGWRICSQAHSCGCFRTQFTRRSQHLEAGIDLHDYNLPVLLCLSPIATTMHTFSTVHKPQRLRSPLSINSPPFPRQNTHHETESTSTFSTKLLLPTSARATLCELKRRPFPQGSLLPSARK